MSVRLTSRQWRGLLLGLATSGLLLGFQNCAKVQSSDLAAPPVSASAVSSASAGSLPNEEGGGPIASLPGGGPVVSSDNSDSSNEDSSKSCNKGHEASSCHQQYLLDQVVVAGVAKDLSVLKQHLQMQLLGCDPLQIRVQGEGLCTAFHGSLMEAKNEQTQVMESIFSVKPASDKSSACKDGTFDKSIYDLTLDTMNASSSVDFQANGDLVVKAGDTTVVFIPKH